MSRFEYIASALLWVWVTMVAALYMMQFRALIGPALNALGLG